MMFGQHDDESKHNDGIAPDQPADGVTAPDNDQAAGTAPQPAWQHPGSPLGSDSDDQPSGAASAPIAPIDPPMTHHAHDDDLMPTSGSTDDLVAIKQQALTQLSPLVGHLDQTPEEKFRTTMMMIQASDDQSLVKSAYESAQQITDEKTRAQALLDIVNEINYFTQHTQN